MNAGLRIRIALHADRFTRAFARARIRGGALTANRQTAQVTNATVALDRLEALEVDTNLTAEIAFDDVFAVLDRVNDLRKLLLGEVLGADAGINLRAREDILRVGRADAIDVAQRDVDALVARDLNSDNACHSLLTLTLFVTGVRANHTNDALATNNFAILAKLLY
jgi:hypothetical protein